MKRFLFAILVGVTAVMAKPLTYAGAQRQTGDQAVRLARTTLETSVEGIMADRRSKCMNAIGSPAFCDCLNSSLPLATDFQTYITVTTASKAAYEQLTPDNKKVADLIISTRDQCVENVFATTK